MKKIILLFIAISSFMMMSCDEKPSKTVRVKAHFEGSGIKIVTTVDRGLTVGDSTFLEGVDDGTVIVIDSIIE